MSTGGEERIVNLRLGEQAGYDLVVFRALGRRQMGKPRASERPDYSVFT